MDTKLEIFYVTVFCTGLTILLLPVIALVSKLIIGLIRMVWGI